MPATISLIRGLDWVSTGLYDTTKFNAATDYVAKYTLVNVTGDPASYKAKVYLVTGTQNQYCIQHTDGTIYVLDGYDPFDCVYYMHWFASWGMYTSASGSCVRSMAIDRFMVMPKNFVTCPLAGGPDLNTRTDTLNPYVGAKPAQDTIGSTLSTYLVDSNGNKQLFTQYYYDPVNGVPSQWTGIEYIPVKDHSGINSSNTVQFESAAYHKLFFQDEPFTYLNIDPSLKKGLFPAVSSGRLQAVHTWDVPTYPSLGRNGHTSDATWGNKSTFFGNTKTLNFLIPSGVAQYQVDPATTVQVVDPGAPYYQYFAVNPYYQYYVCYQPDVMGCYTNSSGVRVNLLQAGYVPNTPAIESYTSTLTRPTEAYMSCRYYASQAPAAFTDGSTIGALTPIAFPTIALSNQTVSLRNLPVPVPTSQTTTLFKGVDYVLTGIYAASDFPANSIVVKCNFGGTYVKLAVSQVVTGIFTVTYNHKSYILDSFDPFEVYYTLAPQWGNLSSAWTMQADKSNSRMMRTFDKYPHFPSRIQPAGYSTSGSYNAPSNPMQYFYTASNGSRKQFSHFSFDSTGDMTIQHGGELFLFDPSTINIANPTLGNAYTSFNPTAQTRSAQYHQLFLAGEKCKAYNCTPDNMGNQYTDGRPAVASVADFIYSNGAQPEGGDIIWTFAGGPVVPDGPAPESEILECSITLEPTMKCGTLVGNVGTASHSVDLLCYQGSDRSLNPYNYFAETNYGTSLSLGLSIIVPSPAGMYFDSNGARFDVVTLSHYGGFYTCIESLTNRVSNTPEWQAANGLTCILDGPTPAELLATKTQALTAAQAQIATLQDNIASSASQIATLQTQIASLTAVGSQNSSDLAAAQSTITAAHAQIATLQASITADTAQIATLQAQVDASAKGSGALLAINLFGLNISITYGQVLIAAIFAGLAVALLMYFKPTFLRNLFNKAS